MVQESVPPATTEGYAILAAPLALHSYSAWPHNIPSHLHSFTVLAGQILAPLPIACLLHDAPLHFRDADLHMNARLLHTDTTLSSSSVHCCSKGSGKQTLIRSNMHAFLAGL